MFARLIVNRKWMVVAGAAAILALVVGIKIGRSIIPSSVEHKAQTAPKPAHFADPATGLSLTYPGDWTRRPTLDSDLHLLATHSPSASMSLRVSKSDLAVTPENVTVPVVRRFTDELVGADRRTKQLVEPEAVTLGGLPGYRYVYTYTTSGGIAGAHIHYFLFKPGLLIQLVFQALPATTLPQQQRTFNSIARTLVSR